MAYLFYFPHCYPGDDLDKISQRLPVVGFFPFRSFPRMHIMGGTFITPADGNENRAA